MRYSRLVSSFFLLLPLCFAAGALAGEGAGRSDNALRALIFEAAGYLTEDFAVPGRAGWRERGPASGAGGVLALRFHGADPWPTQLELRFPEGGVTRVLSDSAPYGGPRLKGPEHGDGGGPEALAARLGSILEELMLEGKVSQPEYRAIAPGLSLARVQVSYGVRMGPPWLLIVKADPGKWGLYPYSEAESPAWASEPVDIAGWAARLPGAYLLLTGPQYYADRSAMGYLGREGAELEAREHPRWKGFLGIAGPEAGGGFRIADLSHEGREMVPWQGTVLQSFMVVDRTGDPRVRDTDKLSSRVTVGEDQDGSLVIVFVQGSISLHDLALLQIELGLFPAIGMDGGLQGQLAVKEGGSWEYLWGEYSHNALGNVKFSGFHPSLPFVLALEPLKKGGG
jgi:hypothetical protein